MKLQFVLASKVGVRYNITDIINGQKHLIGNYVNRNA